MTKSKLTLLCEQFKYHRDNDIVKICQAALEMEKALKFYDDVKSRLSDCKGYCPEYSDVATIALDKVEDILRGENEN